MFETRKHVIAMVVAVGLVVSAGATAAQQPDRAAQQPAATAAGPERIEMVVHGMSCPFCAYGVEKKLRRLEGVDSLSVDFKSGRVMLYVRDGSKITDARLRQLVKDAGFEVMEIKRFPLAGASPAQPGEGA